MKSSKKVVTKRPSNSSSANPKTSKSYAQQPQPVPNKKPKAKIVGSSTQAIKKLNPGAKQSMRRPGLVTSRASGG